MVRFKIDCPNCEKTCLVPLVDGELAEDSTTEGFVFECACGCEYVFDVYCDVMNKEITKD